MGIPPLQVHERLHEAIALGRETPDEACAEARAIESDAIAAGDTALRARAVALQGKLMIAQGLLDDALALGAEIEILTHGCSQPEVTVATETFRAQLAFFVGAYGDAIGHATRAVTTADADGRPLLRSNAMRGTCFVLGTLDAPRLADTVHARVALSELCGDGWERAVARSDLAQHQLDRGDVAAALVTNGEALAIANGLPGDTPALDTCIRATRAQILQAAGRSDDAAACAVDAVRGLERAAVTHPYLLGVASVVAVEALAAAGRLDEAVEEGQRGVARIGGLMPLTRSAMLATLAGVLRRAGRADEAYEALSESVELERNATRQFASLQRDLENAVSEHVAARREADELRIAAERDWLTGVFNRRYLARLDLPADEIASVAIADLDDFKAINDAHGHDAGDRVLVRIAQLLSAAVRSDDVVVRVGGDEFVVVMPGAGEPEVAECTERMHTLLGAEPWALIADGLDVRVSCGSATGRGADILGELMRAADRGLYDVKRARPHDRNG